MQYMLLIHFEETAMPGANADAAEMSPDYAAYTEALKKAGVLVGGDRLQPTSTARIVRADAGKTQVLDGPFIETREQLGGYYLIDVAGLDEAVEWASRCPSAAAGAVEVRPVWSYAN